MNLPPYVTHLPMPQDDDLTKIEPPPKEPFAAAGFEAKALEWDNRPIRHTRIPFTWPSKDAPLLRRFTERYDFLSFIEQGTSEWERVMLMREWIFRNIPKGRPVADPLDPFRILDTAAAGARYICTQFMVALHACFIAAGWPSRRVQSDSDHTADEHSTSHGIVDVWVNDLDKWVMFDAMYNVHYEKDGVPLSAWELGNEWIADQGGHVDVCIGMERKRVARCGKGVLREQHESSAYFWVKHTWTWDPFSSYGSGPVDSSLCLLGDVHDGKMWYQGRPPHAYPLNAIQRGAIQFTKRVADVYPDMNRCRLAVSPSEKKTAVHVKVNTFTPGFDTLLVRVDGTSWRRADAEFDWYPHPGENVLSVCARNEWGILGKPVTVKAMLGPPPKPSA
jgi:hypothetical protein